MKYFTYLAISVMIIAVTSLFYLKKPDGQTWLSSSSISAESHKIKEKMVALSTNTLNQAVQGAKQAGDKISGNIIDKPKSTSGKIYKWKDETGQWHFSDTPNPNLENIELKLDPADITVVAAEDTSILNRNNNKMITNSKTPLVFNPSVVEKLFNDVGSTKEALDNRNEELKNAADF